MASIKKMRALLLGSFDRVIGAFIEVSFTRSTRSHGRRGSKHVFPGWKNGFGRMGRTWPAVSLSVKKKVRATCFTEGTKREKLFRLHADVTIKSRLVPRPAILSRRDAE